MDWVIMVLSCFLLELAVRDIGASLVVNSLYSQIDLQDHYAQTMIQVSTFVAFIDIMDAYLYNFCIFSKALAYRIFKTIWYQYVRVIFAITFISQINIEFGMYVYYHLLFFHSWNCFSFGFTTFSIILVVQK